MMAFWRVAVAAAIGLTLGCESRKVEFRLNLEGRDPQQVSLLQREAIAELLKEWFGTPDEPRLPPEVKLDLQLIRLAALGSADTAIGQSSSAGRVDARKLAARGLYRRHCALCHGISGDGAGSAALLQYPYPRDFRRGIFKYTSTAPGIKPTRADIERIIRDGMPGTSMPSFRKLSRQEIAALAEYVRYLALRGEVELLLVETVVDGNEVVPFNQVIKDALLEELVLPVADSWQLAEDPSQLVKVEVPSGLTTMESLSHSLQIGRKLYLDENTQCVKCHGVSGDGHGEQTDLYDVWNEAKRGATPEQTEQLAKRFMLPLQRLKPRDLRQGIFHGGSQPEDLFLRLYVGIKGTPMPGVGPTQGNPGVLSAEQTWHLVRYVLWLSGRLSPCDHNLFAQKGKEKS